jgi:polysaccharide deacetylase family protein (PEP-CTERM system associated)
MISSISSLLGCQSLSKHHAFTIDVEDWYHGAADEVTRTSGERRLCYGLGKLLDILAKFEVKATFFWLGLAASENPCLVKQVAHAGHEIACHGWVHEPVYSMSPQRFREETQYAMSLISDLSGQPVIGYRAPYFSITRKSLWALEILADIGFEYDSSIFPIKNWRYGISDFNPMPQQVTTSAGTIYEMPLSVRRILGNNLPISGGAYFRIYPYAITQQNFRTAEHNNQAVIFYIHPWELDLEHPPVPLSWKEKLTHSINLHTTEQKLHRLLSEFSFVPLRQILVELVPNRLLTDL